MKLTKKHTVEELFEVASGSTPSTSVESYWSANGSGIKWITPKDLSGLEGSSILTTERKITLEGLNSCSARLIPKGSIILSSRAPIGYVAVMKDEMACNQGCKALIPKRPKEVDPLYFYYLFLTKEKELNNLGSGSTFKELSKTKLEEFSIEVHDVKEQQEIAHVLEQADKARQRRQAANALTDQFLQSSFLSLFGDPVKNEKGWKTKTIGESDCEVQIGPFGTQLHAEDYIQGGIPLINPKHIQSMKIVEDNDLTVSKEKYAELPNYHLQIGDIIMARRGEMARCALISERENGWFCGTGSLYIRPSKEFDSTYLLYVLSSASIKERLENDAQGVTMANLNQTIINNLTLSIPPLSLQQQFAGIVAQAEQLRQKQRESERELENLFQGLLQRYFG